MGKTTKSHLKGHENHDMEASKPFRALVFHIYYIIIRRLNSGLDGLNW